MLAPFAGAPGRQAMKMSYRVEIEEEEDGRFLAEVLDLPGVMAYGETAEVALAHAQALALLASIVFQRTCRPPSDSIRM